MTSSHRVAVIGGGIVGLAHAWSAAERGHHVTLFERNERARGASVRNFGMIWPIGQPPGDLHELALASRARWLQLANIAGIWVQPCGSIHLAHRSDEQAVLREFVEASARLGFDCTWLTAAEVLQKTPAANPDGLLGGMFSPTELCVDPRKTIDQLPHWLEQQHGVRVEYHTQVQQIDDRHLDHRTVVATDGRRWEFDRIVVCSGADFGTLYPELLRQSGMVVCKLQMLKTNVQASHWRLGPHLASGLTLRHYRSFEVCPSLPALKQRIAAETPELDRLGIHVMASQNESGQVILGDSHEYGAEIEPFDKTTIDDLMLRELRRIIRLPDWSLAERWHGYYAKYAGGAWYEASPLPHVHICNGLGGAGMTMSFGIAERFWQRLSAE